MKKLQIRERIEEGKPIYYINILKLEVCFYEKEGAENALASLIQLLRRNGGLAKRNERKKMANLLAERGLVSAADLVRGVSNGQSEN